jgi:hypothetical protein
LESQPEQEVEKSIDDMSEEELSQYMKDHKDEAVSMDGSKDVRMNTEQQEVIKAIAEKRGVSEEEVAMEVMKQLQQVGTKKRNQQVANQTKILKDAKAKAKAKRKRAAKSRRKNR